MNAKYQKGVEDSQGSNSPSESRPALIRGAVAANSKPVTVFMVELMSSRTEAFLSTKLAATPAPMSLSVMTVST